MKTTFFKFSLLLLASALCVNSAFAQLTVSLTVSTYNGYNVSCFGGTNGSITANPSGGTSPYTYRWSNATASTTQTLSGISASYYVVTVTDASHNTATAGVTLREPTALSASVTSPAYSDGYNVSCYQCFNGSISNTPSGGVGSYTYLWNDGVTTQNRSSIGGGTYQVTITDANSCSKIAPVMLTEAPRDEWAMDGNSGSNPSTQYIGTADNTDLVFKTNATERMRVIGSGNVQVSSDLKVLSSIVFGNNKSIGYAAAGSGIPAIISYGGAPNTSVYSIDACVTPILNTAVSHQFSGSIQLYGYNSNNYLNVMQVGFDGANAIIDATGTSNDPYANRLLLNYYCGKDVFVGNSISGDLTANRNFYAAGKVGIGTTNVTRKLVVKGDVQFIDDDNSPNTSVNGLQILGNGQVPSRRGISLDQDGTGGGNFNFWIHGYQDQAAFNFKDGSNSATYMTINKFGMVGIGTTTMPDPDYKLYVTGGIKTEKVKVELCSGNWCDYVFDKDYKLQSLVEVEKFVKENNHLPGIPSAAELENNGLDVGEMLKTQMQKIEELTLYMIELKKENDLLKAEVERLK